MEVTRTRNVICFPRTSWFLKVTAYLLTFRCAAFAFCDYIVFGGTFTMYKHYKCSTASYCCHFAVIMLFVFARFPLMLFMSFSFLACVRSIRLMLRISVFSPSIFLLYNVHYKEQYAKADDSSDHIICRSCPLRTCSSKKTNKTSDSLAPTRSPFCRKLVSRRAWRTQFYIAAPPFLPEPPALE